MVAIYGWYVDTVVVSDPSASQEDSASSALTALEGTTVGGAQFYNNVDATTNAWGYLEDADTDEATYSGTVSGNANTGSDFTFGGMTKTVDEFVNYGPDFGGAANILTYDGVDYPVDGSRFLQVALFTDGTYMVLVDDQALRDLLGTLGISELDPNLLDVTLGGNEDAASGTRTFAAIPTTSTNLFATPAPDGVVDGADTGETMSGGYTDANGDQIDNSGNTILANGGDDTVYAGTGDDTIDGGAGNDQIFAGDGNDLVSGGADNDSIWGDLGNDTLYGNDGDDKLIGGGNDDLLTGGAGNDLLYGDGVFGDTGGWAPTDTPEADYGNDTLVLDGGNDTAYGGSGDDTFQIFDGFGNDQIVGGEAGEVNGDTIDGTAITGGVNVVYTSDEQGTITDSVSTINFDEIENLDLGSGDDTVQILTSTTGTVNGSDGFDTLDLPVGAPGDPAPVVTVTSETPYTGTGYPGATTKSGFVDFPDGSRMYFENFEEILCFTPGTRIDTTRGLVAVEDLQPGDRVLTRDNGYQPLAWTGRRDLSAAELAACPAVAPVRIAAGALGKGLPERDLVVSPRHRMLITGARAELMFGEREVLVAAADLIGLPGVSRDPAGAVSYIHVMCDAHEIIRAEGAWSESFQPAETVLNALDAATRAELLGLFPALGTEAGRQGFAAVRPVLSGAEAKVLFAA
ncbi:MAG: Hint domain-containing protein [Rhodobacter sp.]|nr:Hint domain-containing protein [Rhodobacter sp.]